MQEAEVWELFKKNWVFRLYWWHNPGFERPESEVKGVFSTIYRWIRSSYLLTVVVIALVILLSGALGAALAGDLPTYIRSLPPYLNSIGIGLGFLAFAWFTKVFPSMIASLSNLFAIDAEDYEAIVSKRAGQFAGNYVLMLAFSLVFALLNLSEVREIWLSPKPPAVLASWTTSSASAYFALFYGVIHAVLIPFILGSGTVGIIATMVLLRDLFEQPIHLEKYRRTETVINFSTWLLMWVLIGFASISLFGRSIVISRADIQVLYISGFIQSLIAIACIVFIGSIPLIFVRQAIKKAKIEELIFLEGINQSLHEQLHEGLENAQNNSELFSEEPSSELKSVNEWLQITTMRMKSIEDIPSLPIHLAAMIRVALGTIVAIGTSIINEWFVQEIPLP